MKFRKDNGILIFLGISIVMILSDVILSILIHPPPVGLILGGLILFASGLYAATKTKTEIMIDERVIRINEKAGYNSYWIIMGVAGFLWIADIYLKLNMKFSDGVIPITFIGMFVFLILRWYYNKKGEV